MTDAELIAALSIDAAQLGAWRKLGLPCEGRGAGRRYSPERVRQWLIEQGLAEAVEPAQVARTLAEVAQFLGLSERRIHEFKTRGMPGRPGHYPLDEIAAWYEQRIRGQSGADHTAELVRIRARREALELQKSEGRLVDVDLPARIFEAASANARQLFAQLPDRVAAALPESLPPELRARVRELTDAQVLAICEQLADALVQWAEALRQSGPS